MRIEELRAENEQLLGRLNHAENVEDYDTVIELKRKIYSNKLKMLDAIEAKNEQLTITARELRSRVEAKGPTPRYATGVAELDGATYGGFEVGSLIQLAGASFAGKTTLFLQIVANIAKYSRAVFFNFEMGDRRITKRLTNLLVEDQQWDNMLINSETRDIDNMVMEITLLADTGVKFFAVDSRMKLRKTGNDAEYQKIAYISNALSACAVKNDIIILMINQISEEDLKAGRLSFKGSGDQMFDADMALFITADEETGDRTLICTKNRQDERTFSISLPKPAGSYKKPVEVAYEMEGAAL